MLSPLSYAEFENGVFTVGVTGSVAEQVQLTAPPSTGSRAPVLPGLPWEGCERGGRLLEKSPPHAY